MTNRLRITAIIAAGLIATAAAATTATAQTPASPRSSVTVLPGVGSQIASCDIGKSKGPLGY